MQWLKELLETSGFQKKIEAENILVSIENGELVFRAILCLALRNREGEEEYSPKDSERLKELAENNNEWWRMEFSKGACWLVYYPYRFYKKTYPEEWQEHTSVFNMGRIAESFCIHIG